MKINSVNIINLERRTDLRDVQLETWKKLGFSETEIVFHPATDGMDYSSKSAIAEAAFADGFRWYPEIREHPSDHWMGVGEIACQWSIARLLRYISIQENNDIYLYVLADRYSKKDRATLEFIFSELPDFKFLQFRGAIPHEGDHWYDEGWRRPPLNLIQNDIEFGNLKIGDGVIAITPSGARWMQEVCEPHLGSVPYEVALFVSTSEGEQYEGIYSTYNQSDEVDNFGAYYSQASFDVHEWEGQYPYDTELGKSDIGRANEVSNTGHHRQQDFPERYL